MSRLFGVTVGALLGVETPAQPGEESAEREAERLEAILEKYTGQTATKPEFRRKWLPVAVLAGAFVLGLLLWEIGTLRTTVKYLRSEVSSLQVQVYSHYPRLYWPESAHMTVMVNDEMVLDEEMTVEETAEDNGAFPATIQNGYLDLTLKEGDKVATTLTVTDNLGREQAFSHVGTLKEGRLEQEPIALPVIWE